ncbi:MAG: polysaccharide pyruvyl transferase family protein [Planctomycetes bacterium]|nr:polysaccharide pyruvyl transferase family protein [Planctomycetota bacterium]
MTGEPTNGSDSSNGFISDMRIRIDEVLAPLLPSGGEVAMLDYPRYSNVGDSFIWMGTRTYLRSRGLVIHPEIHARSCDNATLRRMVGDRPIVLQGGGNFGDIHPLHQEFRAEILKTFPRQRIVLCPQTFHYQDPLRIEKDRRIYEDHPDLHLVWRDHTSLGRARRAFPGAHHLVAPDMAFWMDVPVSPVEPRCSDAPVRILYHAHRDTTPDRLYDLSQIASLGTAVHMDWREVIGGLDIHKSFFLRASAMRKLLAGADSRIGTSWLPAVIRRDTAIHLARSRNWLAKAIACYGHYDVLLTNRLHGHVLATLLRKPHVIVDTFYGKLDWYHESWTRNDPINRRARDYETVPAGLSEVIAQLEKS